MKCDRCFFIGHRDTPEAIYPRLLEEIEKHIVQYGVREFLVGQYGSFDQIAAKAVRLQKQRHPDVLLTLLLPYHPGEPKIILPDGFDGSLYPEGQETAPRRLAIVRANRYAVGHSGYLIAYAWQPGSNARKVIDWAQQRREVKITLIPADNV